MNCSKFRMQVLTCDEESAAASHLALAASAAYGLISKPTASCPQRMASMSVVPTPQNGSSTTAAFVGPAGRQRVNVSLTNSAEKPAIQGTQR